MKRSSVALLVLLALSRAACAPALGSASPGTHQAQQENKSIERWAAENYHRTLDLVLQDRCASATDARWFACIRIVPSFRNEIEYSLSIQRNHDGGIVAQITRPKVHSIYIQLCDLKKKHAHAPLSELVKLIELESQTGDQRRFPRI